MMPTPEQIAAQVRQTLTEDVGQGDLTAGLIAAERQSTAVILCREPAVLCGRPWVDAVYRQLDPAVRLDWQVDEGAHLTAGADVCHLQGSARALLTGERSALNWLQTLSGTATTTAAYVSQLAGLPTRVLDTRKTLPGMRLAQKYAVRCGGGANHRIGLFDAMLVKENHIAAAGSISAAVHQARTLHPGVELEVEVETLEQLAEALDNGVMRVLLDNFSLQQLREAVRETAGRARLEASGNVSLATLRELAETGVDDISIGALTKHLTAVDFSMRFRTPA